MHEMPRLKPSPPHQVMKVFKRKDANTTSTSNDFTYFGRSLIGEVMLIGATATHLNDYFLGNIFKFQNLFKSILKTCTILLSFVLKIYPKYVIFQIFQIHLQIFLLLKSRSSGYMNIALLLKVQMVIK
jgi:hypothetical protein